MDDNKSYSKYGDINRPFLIKIIEYMEKNKYVSAGDIIREMGLSYQEGMKYVLELLDKGIIVKTQISSYYSLNDKYRKSKK